MTALTVRMPDEKYQRLKALAKRRHTSVNRLIDEMATMILVESDAETRFLLRAQRGRDQQQRGLDLLAKAAERPAEGPPER